MNIKSLLLGSAAALLAASGARAADAIEVVAEPEPVEYVRVCDTYGTGYFYIPGTETCLRIGGYVRYDIRAGDGPYGSREVTDVSAGDGSTNDTYWKRARLALRTWTGTETELGTLSTFTETRFQYDNGAGTATSLNFAWIQLGGFRVGKDESVFTTFTGYAGGVIVDDYVPYGPFDTNLISYTFDAGNGFSAIISLEQGNANSYGENYVIDSYIPHVVAGAKYAGDWGSATLVGAYDSVYEEWSVKGRVNVNVNEALSLFVMAGYGSGDGDSFNFYKPWKGDWAVWAGGSYKLSDRAVFNLQGSYSDSGRDGLGDSTRGGPAVPATTPATFPNAYRPSGNDWAINANVAYTVVPGFVVTPEVSYFNIDDGLPDTKDSGFAGWLRFQRNF